MNYLNQSTNQYEGFNGRSQGLFPPRPQARVTALGTRLYIDNILRTNNIDIILGDFNINYFNEFSISPLKQLMNTHGYIQIIDEATFILSGSLLDQVFVKQSLWDNVQNKVIPVYY